MVGSIYVDPITFVMTEDDQKAVVRTLAESDAEAEGMWNELEAFGERQEAAMADRLPPGIAAEMELIQRYMEAESGSDLPPPAHPVIVLLALESMGAPPSFPESVDPIEWGRTEREHTRRKFEAWLAGHDNSTVRTLPESTHLVPRDAPQAIAEAIDPC